ncbi:hypothetical protein AeMF1_012015 [Aphanomyces euteiches]|nr:hypothetical protein AeMF1_012015 [Aphanomyces euteiches]KAH9197031.1 hypothetical protein AeNC1_000982 [Aphanomyces euteiches]
MLQTVMAVQTGAPAAAAVLREKRRLAEYGSTTPKPVKRTRSFTDYDYEQMLCTILTMAEDVFLLLDVVADVCADKHCRCCPADAVPSLQQKLVGIENTILDNEVCTLQMVQAMCVDMFAVLKYLLGTHYADLVALGLGHLVVGSRNQFAQFMMQYSLN